MLEQNTDRSINTIGVVLLAGAIMLVILAFVPDAIKSLASTADGVDVIYELNGGSSNMEKRHLGLKGEHTIPLEEPTIDGYHFAGWENSTTGEIQLPGETFTPKQHTTMTATWGGGVGQHNIKYDVNGGEGEYPLQRVDLSNTYTLYPNEPVLEGHTFGGWHNSHTGGTNYPNQTITPDGDILFTANWTLNSYDVTYHLNSGSGSFTNTEIDHFAQFNIPNTKPTRTGYDFTGWLVESDDPTVSNVTKQPGQSIEITGRTRLTAQWSVDGHTVTYDLDGGVGTSTGGTVEYNDSYKLHTAAPTRAGYTFQGWKRSDTGAVIDPGATFAMPANSVTLTAQWTINQYKVAYAVDGGSGSYTTASIDYNDIHTISSTTPTREGYTFKGWRRNDTNTLINEGTSFEMPANHVTLTAQWETNSYQVIYNLNDGTDGTGSFSNNTLDYDSLYAVPSTSPTRTGHTFTGWKRSDTNTVIQKSSQFRIPANNVTLTAQWSINSYDITYDLNGGTGGSTGGSTNGGVSGPSGTTKHNYETTFFINETTPTRPGYSFNGWRRNDTNEIVHPGGSFSVPSRNVTLLAQWTKDILSVTYDTNGGSGMYPTATHDYDDDHKVSREKPTQTHFMFVNWTRSGSDGGLGTANPGDVFSVRSNTTLTANWRRETSSVRYDANDGSGAPRSQTKEHGIDLILSEVEPTRYGYSFLGWNTNSSGTGTNYSSGDSYTANSNVTLYAIWSANSYIVTYDMNDGSDGPSNTIGTYSQPFTISKSSIPSRTGYVFAGWEYEGHRYNPNSTITMPAHNITLTAKWLPDSYVTEDAIIRLRSGSSFVDRIGTIPDSHTVGQNLYIYQMGEGSSQTGGASSRWDVNHVEFGTVRDGVVIGVTDKANIILQESGVTYR